MFKQFSNQSRNFPSMLPRGFSVAGTSTRFTLLRGGTEVISWHTELTVISCTVVLTILENSDVLFSYLAMEFYSNRATIAKQKIEVENRTKFC